MTSRSRQRSLVAAALGVSLAVVCVAFALGLAQHPGWTVHVAAWSGRARLLDERYGVRQRGANDCGPAALAHALRRFGVPVIYPEPRLEVEMGPKGCTLPELARAAGLFGVTVRIRRLAPESVGDVHAPAVLHLRRGHYIVLEGAAGPGELRVHDPSLGLLAQTPEALSRIWSGWVLELGTPAPATGCGPPTPVPAGR